MEPVVAFDVELSGPKTLATERKPTASDVGTATHLVLQHLDFSRACDEGDLRVQLERMVQRRLITAAAAKAVDLGAVCWVAGSEIGKLMRESSGGVLREVPVYFARDPVGATVASDMDRVMIRSRLDVLVKSGRGYEIVDYKTDRVSADTLGQRVEFYRWQMELYREALVALVGEAPVAIHLAFLHARKVITL